MKIGKGRMKMDIEKVQKEFIKYTEKYDFSE